MKYADATRCPDCRSDLPGGVRACPTCGLPVRHPLAVELFATLARADQLVAELRSAAIAAAAPEPAPAATPPAPVLPPPGPAAHPLRSAPAPLPSPRTGVGLATVPKILLGLGALCLLVAAIVFLAVSWSLLGVGGRTAVLVSFTALAAASALLLHRHELRIAGESLSVVALGLVALDVLGAESAGWFGTLSTEIVFAVTGVVTAAAGTAMALPRFTDHPRLVAPQVAAGTGYLVAWAGLASATSHDLVTGHVLVAAGAAVALVAHRALPVQSWAFAGIAGLAWLATTLLALETSLADPSLEGLWVEDGSGWSLLASAAALLVPGAALRHRRALVVSGSVSALLVTCAATIPVVDESVEVVGVVTLAVTAGWTLAYRLLPALLRPVAVAPAGTGSLLLLGLGATTAVVTLARVAELGTDRRFGVLLREPDPLTEPLLTVPSVLVPLVFAALVVPRPAGARPGAAWWRAGGVVAGLAAVATLGSYDVPVVALTGALVAVAVGALTVALTTHGGARTAYGLVSLGIGIAALVAGLPSLPVLALASGALVALAAVAHLLGRTTELEAAAALALSPAIAALVWSAGLVGDVDPARLGVPVLALVGLVAIARPRLDVELPAVVAAVLGVAPAVLAADEDAGSLALHLTVAGCLLTATALVHASRRDVAWVGGGVLLLATWVRLDDLGVTAPEPYTLPLAIAVTVLGGVRLHRDPQASTAAALVPGLLLGTVPSLLWVLDDPLSVRALALGAGCLVLTIAGAVLRWSAPLVVGSAVGAVLVLREIGPYAGDVPQWVWIGLAGALLTTVGITWERRLLELRRAVGMLGRLR